MAEDGADPPRKTPKRTMGDYMTLNHARTASTIINPTVHANNFEIKPSLISLVQQSSFSGSDLEDPNQHIETFLQICDTIKMNGVPEDALRLRLFPFSLTGKARAWLRSCPTGSLSTWDIITTKFLKNFFPSSKYTKLMSDISCFTQGNGESFCEAWERFKELLRKCPQHGLQDYDQAIIFFNGMLPSSRMMINAAAGGKLKNKTPEEALELFEAMGSLENETVTPQPKRGVLHPDSYSTILAYNENISQQNKVIQQQLAAITKQLTSSQVSSITSQPPLLCDFCKEEHANGDCEAGSTEETAEVNYMSNLPRNQFNPYSNTYNLGWKSHPNFSYKPQAAPQQSHQTTTTITDLEKALTQLTHTSTEYIKSSEAFRDETRSSLKNQEASIWNLENQIGQLAKQIAERSQGSFPSDTVVNPKEHCKAISTRSGTVIQPVEKSVPVKEKSEKGVEEHEKALEKEEKEAENDDEQQVPKEIATKKSPTPSYAKPPYPQRLKQQIQKQQYARFLDIFKKLQINIPFTEALENMPNYAKFMKDLLSKKHKLQEIETVTLTQQCSAIIQTKLPPKLKDPGSFSIPCAIGNVNMGRALCDLGASINLMPLSVSKALGIKEIKPTMMSLQLADRSIKKPEGVIEDVLVKVDKFIFSVDFVVLNMEEDAELPLLLGRPFLATARAVIDVAAGKMEFQMNDEKVTYNVFQSMKYPADNSDCFRIDVVDEAIHEDLFQEGSDESMKDDLAQLLQVEEEVSTDQNSDV
ncbi:hypothetical protein QN277_019840 [Acacia crassicarpa]|nr:hypothetical protein QN277_019840 [Acacia crassicarpa]